MANNEDVWRTFKAVVIELIGFIYFMTVGETNRTEHT